MPRQAPPAQRAHEKNFARENEKPKFQKLKENIKGKYNNDNKNLDAIKINIKFQGSPIEWKTPRELAPMSITL